MMKKMDHLGVLQECSPFKNKNNISILFYFGNMSASINTSHLSKCGNESTKPWEAIPQKGFICLPLPHYLTRATVTSASQE